MKVLVIDTAPAGPPLAGSLPDHEVALAPDEESAIASLVKTPPQAVILVSRADDKLAGRLRRRARSLANGAEPLWVLLTQDAREELLLDAYAAGYDYDAPLSSGARLLGARLGAVERQVAARLGRALPPPKPIAPAAAASPAAPAPTNGAAAPAAAPAPVPEDLPAIDRTARTSAYRTAQVLFQAAAAKFLTMPVTLGPALPTDTPLAFGNRIVLANAEHQMELAIGVGTDTASANHLSVALFGPGNEEMAADMLGELANVLMGTMKTALSAEQVPYTAGMPNAVPGEEVLRPTTHYSRQDSYALHIGDAKVALHMGLRSRANVMLMPHLLREGMVVAKDVANARGLMLLNKGTRLSLNMIERLRACLPAKGQVEVMAP